MKLATTNGMFISDFSIEGKAILARAMESAKRRGIAVVAGTEDVLLSLAADEKSNAATTLKTNGLPFERIAEEIGYKGERLETSEPPALIHGNIRPGFSDAALNTFARARFTASRLNHPGIESHDILDALVRDSLSGDPKTQGGKIILKLHKAG